MTDKKNIKKITKINNKKSLNTGIIIKPGKIKNKNIVYVNNKPVDIGKKLFDLLIFVIFLMFFLSVIIIKLVVIYI